MLGVLQGTMRLEGWVGILVESRDPCWLSKAPASHRDVQTVHSEHGLGNYSLNVSAYLQKSSWSVDSEDRGQRPEALLSPLHLQPVRPGDL